ncbi:LuxR C-terminal-related transcriptional regulator [Wenyingzhuangia sp. IMCC45574]
MLKRNFLYLFFLLLLTNCYQTPVTPYEEYIAEHWEESQKVIQAQNKIPQSEFINRAHKSESYLIHSSLYFGLIGMIIILNIIFYVNLRNSLFLYYLAFVVSTNITIAYHEGLLYPYVKNCLFTYDFDVFFHHLNIISCFLYFKEFVDLKKYFPKTNKILIYIVVAQLFIFLGYFFHKDVFWITFSNTISVFTLLSFWILSFFIIKHQKSILYFTLGTSLAMITAFFHILFNPIYIQVIENSGNLLKIGLVVETIVLTYAIIRQNKFILLENELMKKRLHIYLSQLQKNETGSKINVDALANKYNLTNREKEVLSELVNNSTNKQIAENLFISINTVKSHIRNIYEKLDIQNRKDLALITI